VQEIYSDAGMLLFFECCAIQVTDWLGYRLAGLQELTKADNRIRKENIQNNLAL
jgi:hypothetical protein